MFRFFLKNVRRGFATNSSSSHSFVYMKRPNSDFGTIPTRPQAFTWNDFRLDTIAEKLFYVLATRMSYKRSWGDSEVARSAKVTEAFQTMGAEYPGFTKETFAFAYDSPVDHQSFGTISLQEALDPRVVVFGGNDNDGPSSLRAEAVAAGEIDWTNSYKLDYEEEDETGDVLEEWGN